MPIPSTNITNGCRLDYAVASLRQYFIQSAQPVPSTKVQVSTMTANTILITYPFSKAYTQVHGHVIQGVMITVTTDVILIPLMGNGTMVCVCIEHLG